MSKQPGDGIWRETIYNDLLHAVDALDSHQWSRQMTQKDAGFVDALDRRLRKIANDLYLARQEILAQAQETQP